VSVDHQGPATAAPFKRCGHIYTVWFYVVDLWFKIQASKNLGNERAYGFFPGCIGVQFGIDGIDPDELLKRIEEELVV
jgi:hypothetical protein